MNDSPEKLAPRVDAPSALDRFTAAYPHAPYLIPFFAFVALMGLDKVFSDELRTLSYAMRCAAAFASVWIFRKHYPSFGRPYLLLAIPIGLVTMIMWVEVHNFFAGSNIGPSPLLRLIGIHHTFEGVGWYKKYALFDGNATNYFNPWAVYESSAGLWSFLIVRIGGAATAVPLIEEIFWRAFLLRLLIDWHRFEDVPLGKFTLLSFLGTSLLSAISHQPQWEVGILCWFIYNGLFYWTRSLTCLIITHGVTNLTLYVYVAWSGDWRFW